MSPCNIIRLSREVEIVIAGENDMPAAYESAVSMARKLGFSAFDTNCVATVVTELARNIISYAASGKIVLSIVTCADRSGIEIKAVDSGPGIPNLETILSGHYQSASGLGLGLVGAKKLLDDFRVDTAPGNGTTVTGIKYGR